MKKYLSTTLLAGFMGLHSAQLFAKEELTVIQTISRNKRSFVIGKGIKDGVIKGQEIIFANDNVSIVGKAIEVNRDFSLWVPVDKNVNVPFSKDEIVTSNSSVYGNIALEIAGDPGLTSSKKYIEQFKKFRTENNFTLKASYNRGLAQSSSSVDEEKNSNRVGYNFSLEYNYRFMPEFEMSAGIRMDNEVYRIEQPELDIPTSRLLGTIAATYHFVNFSNNERNLYLTIAAGIGRSQTTVDEEVSTGIVTILPEARLGYLLPISKKTAMVFEASIESINSAESFSDGEDQTTNILNMKASIGLRF
jgi:hypothetical protein